MTSVVTPAGRHRILIVEDDVRLAKLLCEYFAAHGFAVDVEGRGDQAIERIYRERPMLVILDLMLPGLSGFEVCRRVRASYPNGILILTASKSEADQLVGLELGADDFVIKPVDPRILLARIRGLLRRFDKDITISENPKEVGIAGLTVNRDRREVWIAGRRVDLTMMEFDILWLLVSRSGEAVSREELYLQVRGIAYDGLDRGLDVHISRLRRKLESCGFDISMFKCVRGMGYLIGR